MTWLLDLAKVVAILLLGFIVVLGGFLLWDTASRDFDSEDRDPEQVDQ